MLTQQYRSNPYGVFQIIRIKSGFLTPSPSASTSSTSIAAAPTSATSSAMITSLLPTATTSAMRMLLLLLLVLDQVDNLVRHPQVFDLRALLACM